MKHHRGLRERWGSSKVARALAAGISAVALGACDGLLDVDIPDLLKEDAIAAVGTAEVQVNSAIALFECGYSAFGLYALGHDDAMGSVAGVGGGNNVYGTASGNGVCDGSDTSTNHFDQIMGARAMLSTAPSRFIAADSTEGKGLGVYDRIQDEWGVATVPADAGWRLSAIASIYVAMSLTHFGEFTCEAALDGSDLLTPTDMLTMAEDWITTRALPAVDSAGDFVMPFGITTSLSAPDGGSAREMARAVRARIRWASGDLAGADADAATVLLTRPRFTAWVTRDAGTTRRNKPWHTNTFIAFSGMHGVNRTWNGPTRRPNPATNTRWPAILPHTGYIFLGITTDGRTLVNDTSNIPVRYAKEARGTGDVVVPCTTPPPPPPAFDELTIPGCISTAIPDPRVTHVYKQVQGPNKFEVPTRYTTEGDDIPYMTWEELTLIRAEAANTLADDRPAAIAFVNSVRTAKGLPTVSGAYLATLTDGSTTPTTDRDEMRHLILEERRRDFFDEAGRYWSTKIQNTDVLWFPRLEGNQPAGNFRMLGGVRLLFSADEYTTNPHFIIRGREAARGTGCIGMGPGTNPQVPLF